MAAKRPSRSSPEAGSILSVAIQGAPRLLATFGVEAEPLARNVGLPLSTFADADATIPFTTLGRFLGACARATRCNHFGLLLGLQEGVGALGIVGLLIAHAPDVGTSLRNLSSYLHHQEAGGTASIVVERGVVALQYHVELRVEAEDQVADAAMGIGASLMRLLCGPSWAAREVELVHARPRDVSPYRKLAPRARFGAERNALLFDARWLSHRIETADPILRKILEAKIAELELVRAPDFAVRVKSVVRTMLLSGDISNEATAKRLAMSPRTLHRRLEAHDQTYEGIVESVRFDLAQQLLAHSATPITEVGLALGYANAAAFTRAFRRWAGSTPSAWRASEVSSLR